MLCQQGGGVLAFFRLRRAHGKPSRGRKSRCGLLRVGRGRVLRRFGRRRRQDFRRNAWRAEKLFGQSGQNSAFRRGRSRAVLRFRRQNSLSERIRSDSGGNACLKRSGFCIYAYIRKRGRNVFHSRQKAFQDDNKFFKLARRLLRRKPPLTRPFQTRRQGCACRRTKTAILFLLFRGRAVCTSTARDSD